MTKPIDKRIYKGTCPTCHDFGTVFSTGHGQNGGLATSGGIDHGKMSGGDDISPLLVGFTMGQVQLVDPVRKELSKLYNEEVCGLLSFKIEDIVLFHKNLVCINQYFQTYDVISCINTSRNEICDKRL